MKFLEHANGKYHLSDNELNNVKNKSLLGKFSLHNPVYPFFDLNVFNTHDNLVQFNFKSAVKVGDTFVHYFESYNFTHSSEKVVLEFLERFKSDVEKFKNTVDVKSIIKSIK